MIPLEKPRTFARPYSLGYTTLVISAAAVTLILTSLPGALPIAPLAVAALLVSTLFPKTSAAASIALVLIIRPGTRLFEASLGGVTVTEIDVLIIFGIFASCHIRKKSREPLHDTLSMWLPILAWPIWMLVRTLMPQIGSVIFGSPLVDLRVLSAFFVLIPMWILASRVGIDFLLRVGVYTAYAASAIAILALVLSRVKLLAPGSYLLVNVSAGGAGDVRPGAEVLIPIVIVLLIVGSAPLVLGSRLLSYLLVVGEILASQTLSIVIAAAGGALVAVLLNWRSLSSLKRTLVTVALIAAAIAALGGQQATGLANADTTARFNLAERLGQSSVQYRVVEADTLDRIYNEDPLVVLIGTGPGSSVSFNDSAIHQVKNLTHNAYNNIILKSGYVGLICFVGGFVVLSLRLLSNPGPRRRSIVASLVAVAVLSVTVPFVSTVTGLCGLLWLCAVGIADIASKTDVVNEYEVLSESGEMAPVNLKAENSI